MTTIIAHAGISDITPEQAQQLGFIGLILAFTVPAAVSLFAAFRSPIVVCLSLAQIIALFYSLRAVSRHFIRRGFSGFRYVAIMYSAYALVCCVTNILWVVGLFSIAAAWNRVSPTSPNHALQRTAPCVTAPASAAAFPPAMQVPRRTPRSLSLGSLGDFAHFIRVMSASEDIPV